MCAHLEIHDSHITGLLVQGKRVKVDIDAYVHQWEHVGPAWQGSGWAVPVALELLGRVRRIPSAFPAPMADGFIVGAEERHESLLPLPLAVPGLVTVILKVANGELLEIEGRDLTLQPLTGGRFVEALPGSMAP